MVAKLFPSPRYLLRMLIIYGLGAFISGIAFFFVVALIARPGPTFMFVAGLITGALTGLLIATNAARTKVRWWEHLAHPNHQSA
jgi:Na+/proline symporter